jgi:predicted acetyltransferase
MLDPVRRRHGAERLKLLTVATPDGEIRGYALFRRTEKWEGQVASGVVTVEEAVAVDAAATRALWERLTDLDLTSRIETPPLPVDHPLLHLLVDPRAAAPRLADGLWARIVDLPAALTARGYDGPLDVVLGVSDALIPANDGCWQLESGPDGVTCDRTDRRAQLNLDVRELATVYLGGPTLAALAGAGLVTVDDDAALVRASAAFASPVAPHCAWKF